MSEDILRAMRNGLAMDLGIPATLMPPVRFLYTEHGVWAGAYVCPWCGTPVIPPAPVRA